MRTLVKNVTCHLDEDLTAGRDLGRTPLSASCLPASPPSKELSLETEAELRLALSRLPPAPSAASAAFDSEVLLLPPAPIAVSLVELSNTPLATWIRSYDHEFTTQRVFIIKKYFSPM
jgi:hypothetical protein